jgi:hypothetical protein
MQSVPQYGRVQHGSAPPLYLPSAQTAWPVRHLTRYSGNQPTNPASRSYSRKLEIHTNIQIWSVIVCLWNNMTVTPKCQVNTSIRILFLWIFLCIPRIWWFSSWLYYFIGKWVNLHHCEKVSQLLDKNKIPQRFTHHNFTLSVKWFRLWLVRSSHIVGFPEKIWWCRKVCVLH